jgi:1,4-alpha-glucan branching enzyme
MRNHRHKGYLCLVLQAHLPYIRHPEYDYFLEENWLYEAMTETYIPIVDILSRLVDDGVDFRITLSFSPALMEMFNDDLLMSRYKRHLEGLLELSEMERRRTKGDISFGPLAAMYRKRLLRIRRLFEDVFKEDLVGVLRNLQDTGNIEIITTAATHAFLPNLSSCPQAVKAQIKTGSRYYKKNFGRRPRGMWLPECGFIPGFDYYMKEDASDSSSWIPMELYAACLLRCTVSIPRCHVLRVWPPSAGIRRLQGRYGLPWKVIRATPITGIFTGT